MAPRKRKRGASEPEVVTRLRRGGVSILDAVFTELPDVFYGEILPKLDLLDTANLAQVSKSWNDAVWSVGGVRSLEPKIKAHVEMLEDEPFLCTEPMYWAASENHVPLARALLESGVDVNAKMRWGEGSTSALWHACDAGSPAVVKLLIEAGADVNVSCDQETALDNAARKGFTVIVAMLLKAGADVNLGYPLHSAMRGDVEEANEAIVALLLQAGADIDKVDGNGQTVMQLVEEYEKSIESFQKERWEMINTDPAFQRVLMETRFTYLQDYIVTSIEDVVQQHGNRYWRIKEMLQYAQFMRPAETVPT